MWSMASLFANTNARYCLIDKPLAEIRFAPEPKTLQAESIVGWYHGDARCTIRRLRIDANKDRFAVRLDPANKV